MNLVISPEVGEAIGGGRPVVGLESSNIVGGSYPANVLLAEELDATIRDHGAIPARVAALDGQVHVGLDKALLDRLARDPSGAKVSNRGLAVALQRMQAAGTTVSASLIGAAAAGLRVFAVAGIGGVHRGAETSFDISTDLTQFAETPIAVVCAGAKSLLDPRLTLEYLETRGVPVIGYKSDDFPGYLTVSSGEPVPHRSDDLREIAEIVHRHWADVARTSVLITTPIPTEAALDSALLDDLIREALDTAQAQGATGADLTPFVLGAVAEATEGRSTEVNRAVLLSTVALAADYAVTEADVFDRSRLNA
ncbi:pseudouridine-5'-phosphate glycosidase [Microbacterium imperiale]|uniref:Pseudouridine-5'-phosphate glycosidase n=1 Tax=Microbacterium imperiale TaxID=33884 RepID=A0A9W6HEQ9_9MICO|nr:pseudouridine-5'-phosphate glycosidase [Microbacterium imperiale]MBP2419968.1 pseudouridine-5'-phosphate glycosidase [Microbacterium imperiale]MDS0198168.1 pseudouridine-5'-phosphate glycosidase [Microbacterium imperiale]BFE40308.1 pseudouridine-5'-phosphate glycosidase [Microbacterium imperiale]GLJ78715.1 pseudouridine-5'-phosphate glycosidase [Microbacterium imperiale]